MDDRTCEKGSVTVFLSLVILILISIVSQVLQEAVYQADRIKAASAMDLSLNAVLGEYNRELLEEYGLIFLESSNQEGVFRKEDVLSKIDYYMYKNIEEQSGMLRMEIADAALEKFSVVTDDNGQVFFGEAVKAYKTKLKTTVIEKAAEQIKQYEEGETDRKKLEDSKVAPEELIIPKDIEVDEQEKEKASKIVNPINIINSLKTNALLSIIAGEAKISSNEIDLSSTLQKRKVNRGNYSRSRKYGVSDKIVFDLYLNDQFLCFRDYSEPIEKKSGLLYEKEYIISGKASDKENLSAVAEKIIWIREGVNFVYLLSDKVKLAEAEALATALVGYTGIVPLITATKMAILAAWAYAESLLEARILLDGGKVDFIKTSANWRLTLSQLSNIGNELKEKQCSDAEGMSYEDYLMLFISAASKENKCFRGMDMIERNIQNLTGIETFRMDSCLSYIGAEFSVKSRGGRLIVINKGMGYW